MDKAQTQLDCGCWIRLVIWKARRNYRQQCPNGHGDRREIVQYHAQEWHFRCRAGSCRASRWSGQDQAEAERARTAHLRSRPDHVNSTTVEYEQLASGQHLRTYDVRDWTQEPKTVRRIVPPGMYDEPDF